MIGGDGDYDNDEGGYKEDGRDGGNTAGRTCA